MKILKSIEHDFPNGITMSKFKKELTDTFAEIFFDLSSQEDILIIEFIQNLNPSETTLLNGLITNHVYDPYYDLMPTAPIIIYPNPGSTSLNTWLLIKTFTFPGVAVFGKPQNVQFVVSVDEGDDGHFRLYCPCHGEILCESDEIIMGRQQRIDVNPGNNWPIDPTLIEIHAKVDHSTNNTRLMYIHEIIIS